MPANNQATRLTKKQKRVLKQQGVLDRDNNLAFGSGFNITAQIKPKTINQKIALDA